MKDSMDWMPLSIVVPAYNEEKFIVKTLERIYETIPESFKFEVIVVNNASIDETRCLVDKFTEVRQIVLDRKVSISAARNIGWRQASYDCIAFIDADVLLTDSWKDTFLKRSSSLHPAEADVLTGCAYGLSENPGWIERYWYASTKGAGNKFLSGGNIITNKSVLNTISGFDERLITGEDVDLCSRATKAGFPIAINLGYYTHHEGNPQKLSGYFKREKWHGTGDAQSIQSYLSSTVALVATAEVLTIVGGVVALILGGSTSTLLSLWFLVFIANVAFTLRRFGFHSTKHLLINTFLYTVYFIARFCSMFNRPAT